MPNDMGSFRVDVELENPARPGQRRTVRSVLVDTGAELSWVPGQVLDWALSTTTDGCSARRTAPSSSGGLEAYWSPSQASARRTRSCSGSRAIWCSWGHGPWKA